ncbi:MAG: penicillin acylase family protein [Saprospiraceae bacterium]
MTYAWNILILFFVLQSCSPSYESEEYSSIRIVRDQWGVPHIIAPTDEEVAYGLAWAECEDDFITMQEQLLAINGKLGTVRGKDGIVADFAIKFMKLRDNATKNYKSELSPKVIKILEHFVAGANAYAALHPSEVLNSDLFPLSAEDAVAGYMLGLVEISGAGADLQRIMDGSIVKYLKPEIKKGSNAIAISPSLTGTEETYLAINSHQPLEGWYSWYEAHLISDEGQNILGGTFPGGSFIFHGVNKNLGWAHTVNSADFSDVFQLIMHPKKALHYEMDGEWKKLEKEHIWAWLKILGPLQIPIRKTIYQSDFGTTFKTDQGFFAWRFQAQNAIKAVEQWYRMNRANSFKEFSDALKIRGIPCTNLVYADNEHNIYYLSNGTFPGRNKDYEWTKVIPGYSSDVLYTPEIVPFDSLPQVLNPECGYVFNTNNTPFSSTCADFNPSPNQYQSTTSYMPSSAENLRSRRFLELINQYDSLPYEEFKMIKYNQTYPSKMATPLADNLEDIFLLDPKKHPNISEAIEVLKSWDRSTDVNNESAYFFILCYKTIWDKMKADLPIEYGNIISEKELVNGIEGAQANMYKTYGKLLIPLGEIQRHSRGTVDLPIGGGPDILAAIHTEKRKDGKQRATAGESYIALVRFKDNELPQIETIHSYGASAEQNSPHYTDQMEMFVNQELKPMTLDKEKVLSQADTIYHPMRIL